MLKRIPVILAASLLVYSCTSKPAPRTWRAELPEYAAGSEDDPEARKNWFWNQRAYPTGTIPVAVHREAVQREMNTLHPFDDQPGWQSLGPAPLRDIPMGNGSTHHASGRILAVALHPTDSRTIVLGTAMGGIWKSVDGGKTFYSTGPEQSLPTLSVNQLRYHPTDANVLYAGTGEAHGSTSMFGSGILRSTDGGETWQQLPMHGNGWNFEYSAVTGLQFDARDPNTLYVTTATIFASLFRTPPNLPPSGFFKSTDGGMSWQLLKMAVKHPSLTGNVGFMDLEYGGALAPDLLYVSEYHGGILRSRDGGASFQYVTPQKPSGLGTFPAPVEEVAYWDGIRYHRLKRFPNPDINFDFRRVEIAIAPSNPQVLFAGYESSSTRMDYNGSGVFDNGDRTVPMSLLFKSEDGGDTWRWLGSALDGIPNYCGSQCAFDNVITVNPANEHDVVLGGQANYSFYEPFPLVNPQRVTEMPWRGMVYRSLDGGRSWIDTTPHCDVLGKDPYRFEGNLPIFQCDRVDPAKVIHPDVHVVMYARDGSIYAGTDGGLYRATVSQNPSIIRRRTVSGPPTPGKKATYRWENLNNGLSTLQFYRVASHPTDPNILLGGMQDNSCGYWNGQVWEGWGGGDGTVAFFDPLDPKIVYLGSQFAVHRHLDGGTKEFSQASGWQTIFESSKIRNEPVAFVPVFTIDRARPHILYGASNVSLYRSADRGASYSRVTTLATDTAPTSISVSTVDPRRVWMSTSGGKVYRFDSVDTSAVVADVSAGLPNRHITRVLAGVDSVDTVYAVFSGYDANTPSAPGKVFMSTNGGTTWKNISGNLPDVPASAIALDPVDVNRLWIAQDTAVYSTRDRGTTWTSERRNMPVVGILDLEYNRNTGYLVAATHGRGVWRMAVGEAGQ